MITLVLGGARSGKSAFAEKLAGASGHTVNYIATGVAGDDADFAARIAAHRARRPAAWQTVEAGTDLAGALRTVPSDGAVLIDSLGTWVAAHPAFRVDTTELTACLTQRSGPTVVVSEEVGLGVHPSTELGGRFRDQLGYVNQAVSAIAQVAFLVVAGRALRLDQTLHFDQTGPA
ncbi:MAG: bifunctional adenosylcobinamide kinase/adenosylcobinamide-phosphate guanylyltransferase [Acidimicrobiales bacterium]|nr:bifunctional adenosylcobinamide kinase/adenosylcobinamide-phosphate guanylyltransferase [Acidimicrobiales bacterium]